MLSLLPNRKGSADDADIEIGEIPQKKDVETTAAGVANDGFEN